MWFILQFKYLKHQVIAIKNNGVITFYITSDKYNLYRKSKWKQLTFLIVYVFYCLYWSINPPFTLVQSNGLKIYVSDHRQIIMGVLLIINIFYEVNKSTNQRMFLIWPTVNIYNEFGHSKFIHTTFTNYVVKFLSSL